MKLWESYNNTRAELALYFGQDLAQCGKLTYSRIKQLFDSKPFDNWRQTRENEAKARAAEFQRLDAIIKSIGNQSQLIADIARKRG